MEHLSFEGHLRRHVGEVFWEDKGGFVEASFEGWTFGSLEAESPIEKVLINETDWESMFMLAVLEHYIRTTLYFRIVFLSAAWRLSSDFALTLDL